MRPYQATTLLLAAIGLSACVDSPAEPAADSDIDASFLIGGSPLQPVFRPVLDAATGVLVTGCIDLGIELNKGIANAADEDRFLIRTDIDFTRDTDGSPIASLATKDEPVPASDPKDESLRKGSAVPFDLAVPVSDDAFLALLLSQGDANANAAVALVLKNGSGAETVLDGTSASGLVSPKTQPVLVEAEPARVETTEDANGSITRNVIVQLFMPAVLADAISKGDAGSKSSSEFSLDGTLVFLGDPRPSPIIDLIDQGGGVALVVIAMPIAPAEWAVVDGAVVSKGEIMDMVVWINIVLPDAGDGEVTLMTFASTGTTDPKTDGVPAKQEDDGSGK